MSMISAQIDELRNAAEFYDGFKAADLMRDAADTIWELRDDLQRTNAENAKLREERDHWHVEQVHAYGNWEDAYRRAAELEAENAKLRELVRDMWRFTGTACKKYPRLFDPAAQGGQMVQLNMIDAFEQRMRELGIEVEP